MTRDAPLTLARSAHERFVIALPFAWLVVFFLLPFALVLAHRARHQRARSRRRRSSSA